VNGRALIRRFTLIASHSPTECARLLNENILPDNIIGLFSSLFSSRPLCGAADETSIRVFKAAFKNSILRPRLRATIEQRGNAGAEIDCRVSPHPVALILSTLAFSFLAPITLAVFAQCLQGEVTVSKMLLMLCGEGFVVLIYLIDYYTVRHDSEWLERFLMETLNASAV
jgi:hypothetical protein